MKQYVLKPDQVLAEQFLSDDFDTYWYQYVEKDIDNKNNVEYWLKNNGDIFVIDGDYIIFDNEKPIGAMRESYFLSVYKSA